MEFSVRIPFVELLGFELHKFEGGEAELHFNPGPDHLNSFDVVHGGASMTLLDVVMAHAARSMEPSMGVVTIEMKTSFMRAAKGPLTGATASCCTAPPPWPSPKAVCSTLQAASARTPPAPSSTCLGLPVGPGSTQPLNRISDRLNPFPNGDIPMPANQQILLDNRPEGEATVHNFKLVTTQTPALADGQVLVRHHFLSLDPYMRGRMNDSKSYAASQPLGEVMIGGTVGEVAESKHPKFQPGDKVVGMGGWQEYSVVDAGQPGALRKVDTTHVPLSHYLGAVGMPGVTAWYGLVKIINPKAGDTVVVSAATGAVGSAFGALAKARGCRVPWALPAVLTNASTPWKSWASTPASTTSSTRTCTRWPRRSRKSAPRASTATSRTSAAWCSTPCCCA